MPSGPLVLEVDLTQPFVEDVPHDPVAMALSRRRPALRAVADGLRRAAADPQVHALIAKVGVWRHGLAWAQDVRDAVLAFRRSGKPAVAWAESFGEFGAATVAYYLATGFEEIWLQESGDVGMTGVAAEVTFLRGALDKVGVEPQFGQRHEYKNAANIFTERGFTEPHREAVSRIIESAGSQLVDGIAAARGFTAERVRELIDQAPLTAAAARDAGLIDRVGYRDEVYFSVRDRMQRAIGARPRLLFLSRYGPSGLRQMAVRLGERKKPFVALIHGTGAIRVGRSGRGFGGQFMGSDTVSAAFRAAARDDSVRAIVFRVESPGGSYVASDTIRREVERARKTGKPVVVSMGDVAASGGYFVAMAADSIVAQPGTLTGSIGVLLGKGVIRGLLDRIGLTDEAVAEGAQALMHSPRREYTEDEWHHLDAALDRIYEDFTAKVARHRGLTRDHVHNVARGRVWTGEDAAERGLVDELGGLEHAADLARRLAALPADAPLRPFPQISPLERLRPPQSSEDQRTAAQAWSPGWGALAGLAAHLGLPWSGPLTMPYDIRLR